MRKYPPFIMHIDTPMERYRWDTFWTKEPETIAWIDSFEPGTCFWDVGANVGVYSLYCASLDRNIAIYAFEPQESNYQQLTRNKEHNKVRDFSQEGYRLLTCSRFALGDVVGNRYLQIANPEPGQSGAQVNDENGECVRCETIDSMASIFRRPDYVKIDIDGQELAVVRGMRETISHVRSALVEVSSKTRLAICFYFQMAGFSWTSKFNVMTPHSRERRQAECIDAENIIFTRV